MEIVQQKHGRQTGTDGQIDRQTDRKIDILRESLKLLTVRIDNTLSSLRSKLAFAMYVKATFSRDILAKYFIQSLH